jgi:uncharacterized protein YjbJ (UPF0337 family)
MSGTSQKWDGRWEQLKGRVKSMYGKLTDDEITEAEGDYQRLVGLIEERTGEAREEIERKLSQ